MVKSLSEQILDIANKPVNQDIDIENEEAIGIGSNDENDSEVSGDELNEKETNHYVAVGKSKIRSEKREILQNEKYTGTKSSRSTLYDDRNDDMPQEEEDDDDEEEASDAMSFVSDSEDKEELDNVSEDVSEEEEEDQQMKREKISKLVNQETKQAMNNLSQSTKRDATKGLSILEQNRVFENTVDVRIRLQKALNSSNLLPLSKESWELSLNEDSNLIKLLEKTNKKLTKVFDQLTDFRVQFQLKDNIASIEFSSNSHKKRSFEELVDTTKTLDKELKEYRNAVLNKWSTKISSASGNTSLNSTKFKSINQSADVQVENQLADLTRLVKRTCLNRKNIQPLHFSEDFKNGRLTHIQTSEANDGTVDNEESNVDIPLNYDPRRKNNTKIDASENPYIFDDEDFYRVLLNDLVDKKISNAQNSQGSGANIAITSRSNNKLKKNIDTKASKGRKLNYSVQDSIANYEAPTSNGYRWSDEQIDEFFAGLFGQKINFQEEEGKNQGENDNEQGSENEVEDTPELEAIKNDEIQIFG